MPRGRADRSSSATAYPSYPTYPTCLTYRRFLPSSYLHARIGRRESDARKLVDHLELFPLFVCPVPGLRPIAETFQRKAAALRKLPRLAGNVDRLLRSVRFDAK